MTQQAKKDQECIFEEDGWTARIVPCKHYRQHFDHKVVVTTPAGAQKAVHRGTKRMLQNYHPPRNWFAWAGKPPKPEPTG